MKLIRRWVIVWCAVSAVVLIYLAARYDPVIPDNSPWMYLTLQPVQSSSSVSASAPASAADEENYEYYDSEGDAVGGPLLFPVRG